MSERYLTWIDGEEATVELLSVEGGKIRARVWSGEDESEAREVSFERLTRPGGRFQLLMPDGRSAGGSVVADKPHVWGVSHRDARLEVQALSEREAWLGGGGSGQGEGEVTVSMPGRVVKVLVAVGEAVEEGQPVLVIEAMKMENELVAGRDGVVTAIHVAEGDSVEADTVLAEIGEPE